MRTFVLAELPELALDSPVYTEAQNQLAEVEGATKTEKRWWELHYWTTLRYKVRTVFWEESGHNDQLLTMHVKIF